MKKTIPNISSSTCYHKCNRHFFL